MLDFTPEDYKARPGHASENIERNENGQIVSTRELTEKQQIFIDEYLASGGNRNHAAKTAGYTQPDAAASQLLKNPRVRQVLYDSRELWIDKLAGLGLRVAEEILMDKTAPYGVRASLATRFIDMRHDPKVKALERVNDKRIDEMSMDELIEHERQINKALENIGVIINGTVDKSGSTGAVDIQPIDIQVDVSV